MSSLVLAAGEPVLPKVAAVSAAMLARGSETDGSGAFEVITSGGLLLTGAYLLVLVWLLDGYARMTPGPHRDRRTRRIRQAFRIWACGLLGGSTMTVCSVGLEWPPVVALALGVVATFGAGLALPGGDRHRPSDDSPAAPGRGGTR